jgi:hypothetical protein
MKDTNIFRSPEVRYVLDSQMDICEALELRGEI